jgi:isopenicillin N synthase-like dioxygenase
VQAGDGGLQLQCADGQWLEVTVPPGALLVNLGSLMALWTGGRWRSTLHRVTNPTHAHAATSSRRMSLAFFHKVNLDAPVQPFASCGGGSAQPLARAMDLTRQGILYKLRHLPDHEASAAYHAALAARSQQLQNADRR